MRLKSKISICFIITSLSLFSNVQAEEQLLITVKRMTMGVAATIAQKAVEACRKEGIQITATVVDRTGVPQVVMRDVLAPDLSLRIAEQKAYTAVVFNTATGDMEGRFKGSYSVGKDPKVIIARGGIPIQAGGHILGAVGVSGAPSGETDEKCAKAGIAAVIDDLEMAE
jgi:uncharacterized protein GlcG (DUF336 family)